MKENETRRETFAKMASPGCSAFSNDGQYLANCGIDGKLKIWETATNRLKIDHVPNQHLKSPCSVLKWITVSLQSSNTTVTMWFLFFFKLPFYLIVLYYFENSPRLTNIDNVYYFFVVSCKRFLKFF